jgi:hypothetical protein
MDLGNIALNKLKGIGKERTGLYQMNLVGFRDTDRMNTFNDHLVY